jgi:hypothetical protein
MRLLLFILSGSRAEAEICTGFSNQLAAQCRASQAGRPSQACSSHLLFVATPTTAPKRNMCKFDHETYCACECRAAGRQRSRKSEACQTGGRASQASGN